MKKTKNDIFSNAVLMIISILSVLPYTSQMNIVRIVVMFCLFSYSFYKHDFKLSMDERLTKIIICIVSNIFLATAVVALTGDLNSPTLVHEIQRIGYYILILFVVSQITIDKNIFILCCVALLIFHFSIQVMQYLEFEQVNDFIRDYYTGGETTLHLTLAYEKGTSFRSGSIFINPNMYMAYPMTFFALFLYEYRKNKNRIYIPLILLSMLSIFFTGSRTGIFVAIGVLIFYKIKYSSFSIWELFLVILMPIIILYLYKKGIFSYRVFQVKNGMSSSFGIKFEGLIDYFGKVNILNVFFGALADNSKSIQIDAELGFIFQWYGLLGITWFYQLLKLTITLHGSKTFFNYAMLVIIVLVGCSATIFLNICAFPFFALCAYSKKLESNKEYMVS